MDEVMTSSGRVLLGAVTLPGEPRSVRGVRRFAGEVLEGDERLDTVELLVSEACTNSVRHSRSRVGGMVTLELYDVDGALRCVVIDDGGGTVPAACTSGEPREHGYGVLLIEALADRSGHFAGEQGRLHMWFELDKG